MSVTLMASWTLDMTWLLVAGGAAVYGHIDRCECDGRRNIDRCQYVVVGKHEENQVDVKPIEACCAPVLDGGLSPSAAEDLAAAFKVLADPARLHLLSM